MKQHERELIDEMLETLWTAREQGVSPESLQEHAKVPLLGENIELLREEGLIPPQGEPFLTVEGETQAARIIRRHRLTDVLLFHVLNMKDHEQRERVACITEHSMLPEMMEGICTLLGHPSHSPEGEPIPPGECCLRQAETVERAIVRLSELNRGERGRVAYIKPLSHSRFEKLSSFGVLPGTVVTLLMDRPAFIISFENTELALDSAAVEDIYVTRLSGQDLSSEEPPEPGPSLWGRLTAWIWREKGS